MPTFQTTLEVADPKRTFEALSRRNNALFTLLRNVLTQTLCDDQDERAQLERQFGIVVCSTTAIHKKSDEIIDENRQLNVQVKRLQEMLNSRDDFLVKKELFSEYVSQIQ